MIQTCWGLGADPAVEELRLRLYAHMLGFRDHFSTESRLYSTTLSKLRSARLEWHNARLLRSLGCSDTTKLSLEGPTKSLINNLGPLLGFRPHMGRFVSDYERVKELRITRGHFPSRTGVRIVIRALDAAVHRWDLIDGPRVDAGRFAGHRPAPAPYASGSGLLWWG